VVEFPPDRQEFSGEMALELQRLSDAGTVRILRVLRAEKDAAGTVAVQDLGVFEAGTAAVSMAGDVATFMASDDLAEVTQRMPPGTVVGVVVWENTWAAAFAGAAIRAGGQVVAQGRIPVTALTTGTDPSAD
jgi:hypothetical protein